MRTPMRKVRSSQFCISVWTSVVLLSLFAAASDNASLNAIIHRAQLNSSGETDEDDFGDALAIDGNTVVVGAQTVLLGQERGAAYVFVKPSNGWENMTQTAELTASDEAFHFGASVAINGDTIMVAAPAVAGYGDTATENGGADVFWVSKWKGGAL